MKSQTEFESYYESHLKREIQKIEEKRLVIANKYSFKRYKKWLLRIGIGVLTFFFLLNFIPGADPESFHIIPVLSFFYAIIAPIYIFIKRNVVFAPLLKEYKATIIPKLVHFIDERLTYDPGKGIDEQEFNKSGLFEVPTSYTSEDLITGTLETFSVRLSDVQAMRRSNYKGQSSSKSTMITVLSGFYGYAKVAKTFSTPVFIKPTYTGIAMADSLLKNFRSLSGIDALKDQNTIPPFKTGNAEFDGYFIVRSQYESEVKRVVNPVFIQMLLAFKKQAEIPVHIGMVEKELHFGFSGINLFEVNAHTSLTEKNVTLTYFKYLQLAFGLAEAVDALPMEPVVVEA
jgi:hypothetical protein